METYFDFIQHYSLLGYEVTLSKIYNQESVKMTKRHSYKRGAPISCEQIQEHEKLKDLEFLNRFLAWLYNDIEQQEKTGIYHG